MSTLKKDAVGKESPVLKHTYRWQDAALYNLGIGTPVADLDFLYERNGIKLHPTYAVIPTFEALKALFEVVGGNFAGVVHGTQAVRWHKPFPPEGTLSTVGRVQGVYDLKRMGQAVTVTETRDDKGELLCETEWTIMYLMDGGFGGEAPPPSKKMRPPERPADWTVEEKTSPEQAALYRLSGDHNPLHIDPVAAQFAEKVTQGKPILHGLCTYGYVARAILAKECGNDPSRLKYFNGRFSKPVWPGETIVVQGWREDGKVIVQAGTKEHPEEPVFNNAWAEIA